MTQIESTAVPEDLYRRMTAIYSEYTGMEIAATIAQIRRELNLVAEQKQLKQQIQQLTNELHKRTNS